MRAGLYIRVFPHKSVTSIPLETRMGKGKGEPEFWAAVVRPGTVLYEISGVTEEAARICFSRLAHKMPVRVRFVKRARPEPQQQIPSSSEYPPAANTLESNTLKQRSHRTAMSGDR